MTARHSPGLWQALPQGLCLPQQKTSNRGREEPTTAEWTSLCSRLWVTAVGKVVGGLFYKHEVKMNVLAFNRHSHCGVFYAYAKLKEQETRNIVWVAECISQSRCTKMNSYIPIL